MYTSLSLSLSLLSSLPLFSIRHRSLLSFQFLHSSSLSFSLSLISVAPSLVRCNRHLFPYVCTRLFKLSVKSPIQNQLAAFTACTALSLFLFRSLMCRPCPYTATNTFGLKLGHLSSETPEPHLPLAKFRTQFLIAFLIELQNPRRFYNIFFFFLFFSLIALSRVFVFLSLKTFCFFRYTSIKTLSDTQSISFQHQTASLLIYKKKHTFLAKNFKLPSVQTNRTIHLQFIVVTQMPSSSVLHLLLVAVSFTVFFHFKFRSTFFFPSFDFQCLSFIFTFFLLVFHFRF